LRRNQLRGQTGRNYLAQVNPRELGLQLPAENVENRNATSFE